MISCQQYDYIEIACLFNLPVELTLSDGRKHRGIAQTTSHITIEENTVANKLDKDSTAKTSKTKEESLLLTAISTNKETITVVLAKVVSMQALINNPHFDHISFAQ